MAKEIILGVRVDAGQAETDLGKLKTAIINLKKEQTALNKSIKAGDDVTGEYADELVEVDKNLKKLNTQYTKAIRDQATLNTNVAKGAKTVDSLRTRLSKLTVEWKSVEIGSKRFKELEKEIKDTSTELKKLESNVGNNTRDVGNYGKAIKGVSASLKRMGVLLVTVWAGRAIKNAFNIIKDFEQAQANLKAITNATNDEMKLLAESAKKLGSITKFTAKEVSGLEVEFAKLGFSTVEILNATEATLDLAAATGVDLAEAATVAGNTIRSFGLDTDETGRLVDVMAKSFSSSALDMEKFREAMKLVAPSARATGRSLEKTTSLLGVLADNGISGSIAGTQLNRVFIELNKSGLTLEQAIEKVSTSQNKLGAATELVGDRGSKALLIFAENTKELSTMEAALNDAGGAAERMAETQLDTLSGSVTKLSSAYDGFILSLEDGNGVISETIKKVLGLTTEIFTALANFAKFGIVSRADVEAFESTTLKIFDSLQKKLQENLSEGKKTIEETVISISSSIIKQQALVDESTEKGLKISGSLFSSQLARLEALKKLLIVFNDLKKAQDEQNAANEDAAETNVKAARTVGFIRDEIKKLNDDITDAVGRGDIRKFQEQIKDLKEELDFLLKPREDVELITGDDEAFLEAQIARMKTSIEFRDADLKLDDDHLKKKEERQLAHLKIIQRAAMTFGQLGADFIKSQNADTEEERERGRKQALAGLASFLIDQITMQANAGIAAAIIGSSTTPQSIFSFGAIGAVQAAVLTAAINAAAGLAKGLIRGSFAEGGFTGGGEGFADSTGHQVAGVVHANEYVVPTKVLSTPQGGQMVGLLEAMRRGSFADGGFTTPTMTPSQIGISQLSSDLNELDFAPVVSIVDIREADEDQQVRVDNSRL